MQILNGKRNTSLYLFLLIQCKLFSVYVFIALLYMLISMFFFNIYVIEINNVNLRVKI